MKRFTCKSCGFIPRIPPKKPLWVCPKCGKKATLKRKKTGSVRAASRVKKDPEVEQLLEPLDRTYLPPPREKLFLFYQEKESNE
jgi:rubredoxin